MAEKAKNIHDHMTDKIELARTYARDGAFHTAANVLLILANDVEEHAKWCDQQLEDHTGSIQ